MTAAHCIFDEYGMVRKKSLTEVYLGVHSLTDLENKYGVEKFIFDKRFSILDGKLDHDFAILRLSENVQFNSNVYPICIPKSEFDDFDRLVVAGWGKLSAFEGAPNSLNEVEVEYIDSKYNLNWDEYFISKLLLFLLIFVLKTGDRCNKLNYDFALKSQGLIEKYAGQYSNMINPIHDSHMCAIDTLTGAGACIGDSGGPLMYKNPDNNRWYAIGIVSGGYGVCGSVQVPTLYTIVAKYKNFIKRYAAGSKICPI